MSAAVLVVSITIVFLPFGAPGQRTTPPGKVWGPCPITDCASVAVNNCLFDAPVTKPGEVQQTNPARWFPQ